MLTQSAVFFHRHKLARYLLFFGAAWVTILLVGYYLGTFDQFAHIPFLKKYVDPALYPSDPFLDLRFQNYSFFWWFFAGVYWLDVALGNSEPWILASVMFLAHLLTTSMFFGIMWELSMELFHDPVAAFLSVLFFIIPDVSFGVFPVLEFSLLNRTFVLPFLLLAVLMYLRDRRLQAFILVGLCYNLHALSANFAVGMFLLDSVLRLRTVGWRKLVVEVACMLLCASPVLYWKFTNLGGSALIDHEWFDIVAMGCLSHLFLMFLPNAYVLFGTVSGVASVLSYEVARYKLVVQSRKDVMRNFFLAITLILLVQIVTAQWIPITLVIQLQIIRAGLFATIFAGLYWVAYVVQVWRARPTSRVQNFWLLAMTLSAPFAFPYLVVDLVQRKVKSMRWQNALSFLMAAATLALALWAIVRYQLLGSGLYLLGPNSVWKETALWARDHTPKEALFITPPEKWGIYEADWRAFSERGTIVTQMDLLMVALAPQYTPVWQERFDLVAPGARQQFRGNVFENFQISRTAYYTLSEEDFLAVARKYGASYLVVEKPQRRDFSVVYENGKFIIYDLKPSLTGVLSAP